MGGYEKMGAAGGALGVSVAYLNVGDQGTAEPVNAHTIENIAEVGAYYRRAWGDLRFSVRGGGGYAWFNENRMFLTTGVSQTSNGQWNGYFADGHAGLQYEAHLGRFYLRPEASFDYLYLNENAHSLTGAGPGIDLAIAQRTSERGIASGLLTLGTQYGRDTWFRPEIYGGYRQVAFGSIANTVAAIHRHRRPAVPDVAGRRQRRLGGGRVLAESGHAALVRRHRGRGAAEEQRAALQPVPVRPGDVLSPLGRAA